MRAMRPESMNEGKTPAPAEKAGVAAAGLGVTPAEVCFERCGAFTNTAHFAAIYSLKKRKFVRPAAVVKICADYTVKYRLLPGHYLLFRYSYWSKRHPPRRIIVAPFVVKDSANAQELESCLIIEFEKKEYLERFPPQIADFFQARPAYHGRPAWLALAEKIYTEEEHTRLLELLAKGAHFVEGEENE